MLRPIIPRIGRSFGAFRRSLHSVPPLTHNFQEGVPGLLSPNGFDMAWTQYQNLMVEKLNVLTAGTEYADKYPKDILLKYARDPNSAPIFNYASMAHNNHFFFESLTPNPAPMPTKVKEVLARAFSSIENLQREFIVTASSMFGPGFVWLVRAKDGKYSLLTTFIAGSPYPGAHFRRQSVDMNTEENAPERVSETLRRKIADPPTNRVGAFGPLSTEARMAPGGIDLTPILCLNMWEHAYLPDYGVGAFGVGGKRAYAESWWHVIDWEVVADRANLSFETAGKGSLYTS